MGKVSVRYACTYSYSEVTNAEAALIFNLYSKGEKIVAIKFIRMQYGQGLKEAKDLCDELGSRDHSI